MALPEDDVEEVDPEAALARILDHEHDALVVGPGLRPGLATAELVRSLLAAAARRTRRRSCSMPRRSARSPRPTSGGTATAGRRVLTPHAGEFARLRAGSGRTPDDGRRPRRRRRAARSRRPRRRRDVAPAWSCSRAPGRSSRRPTARPPSRRSRTRRWRPAARATSWPVRSGRSSPRAWLRTMPHGWGSTSTAWPATRSASGSGTPGSSPRTCPTRLAIARRRLAAAAERRTTTKRLGFAARHDASPKAAPDPSSGAPGHGAETPTAPTPG